MQHIQHDGILIPKKLFYATISEPHKVKALEECVYRRGK